VPCHRRQCTLSRVPKGPENTDREAERAFARGVLCAESAAVSGLAETLGGPFCEAVDLLVQCAGSGGTVLVTGLGKSGLIGSKVSATMASLGIPSHAVHPAEAAHGDLGRFRPTDTVIALSYSGETDEVVTVAAILRQDGVPIISITGGPARATGGSSGEAAPASADPRSSLERLATVALCIGDCDEAGGPDFAAPTCSTTAMLALGDALALATARRREFSGDDFRKRHPGGALGGLMRPVTEVLRFRAGENCPLIAETMSVREALLTAAKVGRRPGAILLVDREGRLDGIFTDGDLRRLILKDAKELERPIREVMTRNPRTMPDSSLVRDAVRMFREWRQDEIPVVDPEGKPVGILDVQDLIAMKLVKD
jgi:arabinose-5-phosphate isomerase